MESCRPTSLSSLFFKERPNGIILITRTNNSDLAANELFVYYVLDSAINYIGQIYLR